MGKIVILNNSVIEIEKFGLDIVWKSTNNQVNFMPFKPKEIYNDDSIFSEFI